MRSRLVAALCVFLLGLAASRAAQAQTPAAPSPTSGALAIDGAARLPRADDASEQWDLYADLDSGHRVVAHFLVTNLGPGERNAVVTGHLLRPDGAVLPFRNARSRRRWDLGDDGRDLKVGSSRLSLAGPGRGRHRLRVDKNDFELDLRVPPSGARPAPAAALPSGLHVDLLALGAHATGTLRLRKMAEPFEIAGTVTLWHSWTDRSEAQSALRRIEVVGSHDGRGLFLSQVLTPAGAELSWLAASGPGGGEATVLAGGVATHGLWSRLGREGPPVPATLVVETPTARGSVVLGKKLGEHDPVGDLPAPLRWFLPKSDRPKRVWADSVFHVTIWPDRDPPLEMEGSGVTLVTFPNPTRMPPEKEPHPTPSRDAR